jgi:ABC-2 type transport system permease protein
MTVAEHAGQGFWPAVVTLLRLRVQLLFHGFRRATIRRKIGTMVLALIVGAVLVSLFAASWALLSLVRSPTVTQAVGDFSPLIRSVPTLLLAGAFLGILLTSFGVLLQALYLAGDMDFLMSAPIPPRAVFVSKMLQATLPNLGVIALFGLPMLFGLGAADGFHFLYYPLTVLVMAGLALAASGLASLLVMAIVRVIPARHVAEVLGFLGAILSILCSQSGQLVNAGRFSGEQVTTGLRTIARFDAPWSPLSWAGRGLLAIGEGRWLEGVGYLALVMGLSGSLFGLALVAAERLYYSGWARVQTARRRKAATRPAVQPRSRGGFAPSVIPAPVRAIVAKDSLTLRRDLRNLSQLVTPLVIGVVYAIMLVRGGGEPPPGRGEAPLWVMDAMRTALSFGGLAIALFIGWSLLGRLAGMGFSQEGRNYWLLKSAPVPASQLLSAKFLVAYLPSLILGWAVILVISALRGTNPGEIAFELAVVALCIAGADSINLAFGVVGANLQWDDPRHMIRSGSGCLSALVSLLFLAVSLGLFLGPLPLAFLLGLDEGIGMVVGLLLGGIFTLAAAVVPLRLVLSRVPGLGEA